jgi:hypothetical protein
MLADAIVESLRERPEQGLEEISEVVLGFGRDGRIDAAGIEDMIAVRRASMRATALRRLLAADLDNDGALTRREIGAVMATLPATLRARLVMSHRQADIDKDGTVIASELRDWGEAVARKNVSETRAENWRRLMLLDIDEDGWLTIHEAAEVIARYRDGT